MTTITITDFSMPLQLDWDDDFSVTVTPEDKDRYVVKVRTAIERMKKGEDIEAFTEKLVVLQNTLARWLKGQREIKLAYLTMQDGEFLFVVVSEGAKYDAEFEDRLTDLDIQLAKDADIKPLTVNVLSLPDTSEEAIQTFLDPSFSLSYKQRASSDAD